MIFLLARSVFFVSICLLLSCGTAEQDQAKLTRQLPNDELVKATKAIAENPKNAELYFKRSRIYRSVAQDSLALNDLYTAIKIDSLKANYYSAVGEILFDHKDISGSAEWVQKAILINPDDAAAHLKIAKLFLFTQEYPKAFTEINTVLRSDVYNAEAYFLKGMIYKDMKDTNKAISSFQTAVQTDPKFKDGHIQLALIYKARNNPLAIQYFENAYKSDTMDIEALYGQGMYWQDQEKYEEAKKVFKRIVFLNPAYEKSYYNIGWMLLQQDSVEKAIRQFDMAIGAKQDYVDAYYNRGLCNEMLEKYVLAQKDYEQALVFNNNYLPAKEALARTKNSIKK